MADYRRMRVAGGCYFFTVALQDRQSRLLVEHIDLLRTAVRQVRARRPFHIDAWSVMPEHMHCVWTLPEGDADYSTRWKEIKAIFSREFAKTEVLTSRQMRKGERGIWQRRFWEHAIRDNADYVAHLDYVHRNPYKHGLVLRVGDWPYSSFHQYVAQGVYPEDWLTDDDLKKAGERDA